MKKTNGNKKIVKRCGSIWREKIVFGRGHGRGFWVLPVFCFLDVESD